MRKHLAEIRRSRPERMAAIVQAMVARFGGPNAMARKWHQLFETGSDSFRWRTFQTVFAMDAAAQRERAAEKELLAQKITAGMADSDDIAEALEGLGEEVAIDLACKALVVLAEMDLLPAVLGRMKERGTLVGEELEAVRRAVG